MNDSPLSLSAACTVIRERDGQVEAIYVQP